MNLVAASDSAVVFSKRVSGQPDEILALNAKDGTTLWSAPADSVRTGGTIEPDGTLYLIAKDQLQKRLLLSGKLIWQQPLDKIPEQKTPPRFNFQNAKDKALALVGMRPSVSFAVKLTSFLKPNLYDYQPPAIAGGKLLITRNATESSGCSRSVCFNDWLLLDAGTGKLKSGGSGQYVGKAGRTLLLMDDEGLLQFRDGRVSPVTGAAASGQTITSLPWFPGSEADERSAGELCLFEISDDTGDALAIFDASKPRLSSFPVPQTRTNEQSSWVLMTSNLVRYAQCQRFKADNETRSQGQPWFELYDLKGHCLRSAEINLPAPRDDYWVNYGGRLTNGIIFEMDGTFYQVEVPSLKITETAAPRVVRPLNTSVRSFTHGNIIYQIDGNITVPQMTEDELPHEFVVRCIEATSHQKLWQYVEHVTLHKIVPK